MLRTSLLPAPRVKRVLENSLREAMQMGQSYISTEHLLLGIVREGEGTALEVLGRLNVSGDDVRGALNDLVGQSPVYAGRAGFDSPASSSDSMLTEFGTDLTKKAREGKLDPVIGRASEIERVMQILSRRQKNNPLPNRRARRGQDRHRRGFGYPHHPGADVPYKLQRQGGLSAGSDRSRGGHAVPRPV